MPHTKADYNRETGNKNLSFLALAIPIAASLWINASLFFFYLNPQDFLELPQNIREEHITSLFFRAGNWDFPLSLIDLGFTKIPLSLTDNIPLMAILFKIFNITSGQYFGAWLTLSATFYTFFSYRICKNIFKETNPIAIGLSTSLFISMPFIWYHAIYVPWMAGQWIVLWAYSLYFKRKPYTSSEWFGVMIVSSMVHPFFSFICFFIMIADIVHLYIYNHTISSVQAASSFGNIFSVCFLSMCIMGVFYLPSFITDTSVALLRFDNNIDNYNISYLNPGYGILIGTIFIILLTTIYAKKLTKYILYYRALTFSLIVFLFCGTIGGIEFTKNFVLRLPHNNWLYESIVTLFTSGPKFITSVILILPIIIVSGAYKIEKRHRGFGVVMLGLVLFLQIIFSPELSVNKTDNDFQELPYKAKEFITDSKKLEWVFLDAVPFRPQGYEQLAYYAYANDIKINVVPVIRFPSGYINSLAKTREEFSAKNFDSESVYVIQKEFFPQEYFELGETIEINDIILFKSS